MCFRWLHALVYVHSSVVCFVWRVHTRLKHIHKNWLDSFASVNGERRFIVHSVFHSFDNAQISLCVSIFIYKRK